SVLRRAPQRQREHLKIDDLELDMRRHKATRSGIPLNLTPKEFLLLAHLVRSAGAVVSRDEIAEHVWDVGFTTDTNVVDVVVRRLTWHFLFDRNPPRVRRRQCRFGRQAVRHKYGSPRERTRGVRRRTGGRSRR